MYIVRIKYSLNPYPSIPERQTELLLNLELGTARFAFLDFSAKGVNAAVQMVSQLPQGLLFGVSQGNVNTATAKQDAWERGIWKRE